jgi:glycogen debranching enzyme
MDKIWSWDHCFNALALASGAPELAWDQLQVVFDHQTGEGALPDSITHAEILHNFVKPPIHGWTVSKLRDRLPRGLPDGELARLYQQLAALTTFWLDHRRAPGQPFPHYEHGNDSGWDNATVFDGQHLVRSADLAAFLVIQMRELARLAREIGNSSAAKQWTRQAESMLAAMLEHLWNGSRFTSGALRSTASLLDLMPIILGAALPADVRTRITEDLGGHLTSVGLATERPDSPHYQADGYWRGPVWAPATILIEDGLRRAGATGLADQVSARFREVCEKSGFAENFDALTGQGLRDRAYTWTASAYLLLAEDAETRRAVRRRRGR